MGRAGAHGSRAGGLRACHVDPLGRRPVKAMGMTGISKAAGSRGLIGKPSNLPAFIIQFVFLEPATKNPPRGGCTPSTLTEK